MNKFRTNEDYFDSKQVKAVAVIQRTGGEAVKHVNVYWVTNANYFIISKIMFQVFKEVYEDIDRLHKTWQKYLNFKQSFKKKFVSFYNKLICNDRLLKYFDRMLMNNLMFKLNKSLRLTLINNSQNFDSIV